MKKIFSLLTTCAILLTVLSCEDEDKDSLEAALITEGAILRTLENSGFTIDRDNPTITNMVAVVEFDDFMGDDTLESVDYYLEFIDTTPVGGIVMEFPEVLIGNIPASAFTAGSNGPMATISVNIGEGLTALGVDPGDLYGGDIFLMRLALNTTSGGIFTSTNVGTKIQTSSAFSSPFRYSASVVCPPPAGDWVIELNDSYGDGWDGAKITVSLNGTNTDYTIASGPTASFTITVPPGSESLTFTYISGSFEEEHTYKILAPDGAIVADNGPDPTVGTIKLDLDFCLP